MWTLRNLIDHASSTQAQINGKWVPARPPEYGAATGSVFRCVGNIGGCDKTGDTRCTITVSGPPTQASESLYMCPFNHWRSARWEQTPNATGDS